MEGFAKGRRSRHIDIRTPACWEGDAAGSCFQVGLGVGGANHGRNNRALFVADLMRRAVL